VMVFNCVC